MDRGHAVSMESLGETLHPTLAGLEGKDLMRASQLNGMRLVQRQFSASIDKFNVRLPAIILSRGHYVVAETRNSDGSFVIADPAVGRFRVPGAEFDRDYNGWIFQ
jgi:ABC-type bacteriocin/lantibiotic exporter with double-glycine peptidase domain